MTAIETGEVNSFDLSVRNRDDNFGIQFTGYINVPTDGEYTFYTSSDDGSKLYIGTTQVVDNDGLHGIRERSGTIGLKAGKHALAVTFFEKTGGQSLSVSYSGPGITKTAVPASALFRVPATTDDNQAPTAVVSATPSSGSAPLEVTFSANGSSDSDEGDFILGYEWDFGDGSSVDYNISPTHTYTAAGTYTVTLRVMDNRNLYSAPVTTTITVSGSDGNTSSKLTGTVIGTEAVWCCDRSRDKVFDGNLTTFMDVPDEYKDNAWAGLDLGSPKVITQIKYAPREGEADRMVGGKFQGSNTADFSSGVVDLFAITAEPAVGVLTSQTISNTTAFRYVRYLSPVGGHGNVAEVEFYGTSGSARMSYERTFTQNTSFISVFPNPVDNQTITLEIVAAQATQAIIVMQNLSGQQMLRQQQALHAGKNQVLLRTPQLAKGQYFIIVQQGHQQEAKRLNVTR